LKDILITFENTVDQKINELNTTLKSLVEQVDNLTNSVANVFQIVDQVSIDMKEMLGNDRQPHSVIAVREDNDILLKRGNEVLETITATDLHTKLDPQDQKLIEAFEKSMYYDFTLWTRVYPDRSKSSDPIVNVQIEEKLKEIGKRMYKDWNNILRFLTSLHYNLDDHYGHMSYLCNQVIHS
jgi:hypothetical protein